MLIVRYLSFFYTHHPDGTFFENVDSIILEETSPKENVSVFLKKKEGPHFKLESRTDIHQTFVKPKMNTKKIKSTCEGIFNFSLNPEAIQNEKPQIPCSSTISAIRSETGMDHINYFESFSKNQAVWAINDGVEHKKGWKGHIENTRFGFLDEKANVVITLRGKPQFHKNKPKSKDIAESVVASANAVSVTNQISTIVHDMASNAIGSTKHVAVMKKGNKIVAECGGFNHGSVNTEIYVGGFIDGNIAPYYASIGSKMKREGKWNRWVGKTIPMTLQDSKILGQNSENYKEFMRQNPHHGDWRLIVEGDDRWYDWQSTYESLTDPRFLDCMTRIADILDHLKENSLICGTQSKTIQDHFQVLSNWFRCPANQVAVHAIYLRSLRGYMDMNKMKTFMCSGALFIEILAKRVAYIRCLAEIGSDHFNQFLKFSEKECPEDPDFTVIDCDKSVYNDRLSKAVELHRSSALIRRDVAERTNCQMGHKTTSLMPKFKDEGIYDSCYCPKLKGFSFCKKCLDGSDLDSPCAKIQFPLLSKQLSAIIPDWFRKEIIHQMPGQRKFVLEQSKRFYKWLEFQDEASRSQLLDLFHLKAVLLHNVYEEKLLSMFAHRISNLHFSSSTLLNYNAIRVVKNMEKEGFEKLLDLSRKMFLHGQQLPELSKIYSNMSSFKNAIADTEYTGPLRIFLDKKYLACLKQMSLLPSWEKIYDQNASTDIKAMILLIEKYCCFSEDNTIEYDNKLVNSIPPQQVYPGFVHNLWARMVAENDSDMVQPSPRTVVQAWHKIKQSHLKGDARKKFVKKIHDDCITLEAKACPRPISKVRAKWTRCRLDAARQKLELEKPERISKKVGPVNKPKSSGGSTCLKPSITEDQLFYLRDDFDVHALKSAKKKSVPPVKKKSNVAVKKKPSLKSKTKSKIKNPKKGKRRQTKKKATKKTEKRVRAAKNSS